MKGKVLLCLLVSLNISSCTAKKGQTVKNTQQAVDVEKVMRQQITPFQFAEVKCPAGTGSANEARNICFAGNGDPEEFIKSFNEKIVPYLAEDSIWTRDFGIWHTLLTFKNTSHTVVMMIKSKGDSESMQNDPALKNYNMLVVCGIIDGKSG